MIIKNQTGFTLIETLVAVTILTLAVVGPLFTANRAIVAAQMSRDQLTASYLAQEGIEYVRAVRDNEYLAVYPNTSMAWSNFLNKSSVSLCSATALCNLGPQIGGTPCLGTSSCAASFSLTVNGTSFARTIQVFAVSLTEESIVSTVKWSFHNVQHSVTVTDHLTSWQ